MKSSAAPVGTDELRFTGRAKRNGWSDAAVHLAILLLAAALWQYLPDAILPRDLASWPSEVARRIVELLGEARLYAAVLATTKVMAYGALWGAVAGTVLGLGVARSRPMQWFVGPVMAIIYAIPKVVLISLFILLFGIGTTSKVVLVVSMTLFVFYFNVAAGAAEIDTDQENQVRLMGASRWDVTRVLVIPAVLPYLLTGTRLAVPLAYSAAIWGEFSTGGKDGLGLLVVEFSQQFRSDLTIAVIVLIGALGVVFDRALDWLQRRVAGERGLGVAVE